MMIKVIIIGLLALTCTVWAAEQYTNKFDDIDLDQILNNDRLLNNYVKCLLDQGKCTKDGAELKRIIPDALNSECTKCSDRQRQGVRKVLHFLIERKPQIWDQLEAKYDKEGTYRKKYETEIKQEGLKIRK